MHDYFQNLSSINLEDIEYLSITEISKNLKKWKINHISSTGVNFDEDYEYSVSPETGCLILSDLAVH